MNNKQNIELSEVRLRSIQCNIQYPISMYNVPVSQVRIFIQYNLLLICSISRFAKGRLRRQFNICVFITLRSSFHLFIFFIFVLILFTFYIPFRDILLVVFCI